MSAKSSKPSASQSAAKPAARPAVRPLLKELREMILLAREGVLMEKFIKFDMKTGIILESSTQ